MRDEARKGNRVVLCGVWGLISHSPHLSEPLLAETAWAFFFYTVFSSLCFPPFQSPARVTQWFLLRPTVWVLCQPRH